MWRWRDAAGHLHYSNVQEKTPSSAVKLDNKIGVITMRDLETSEAAEAPVTKPAAPRTEYAPAGPGEVVFVNPRGKLIQFCIQGACVAPRPYLYIGSTGKSVVFHDEPTWLRNAMIQLEERTWPVE